MFHEEFYPTPLEVARIMLEPYEKIIKLDSTIILDPQAGKGDLLDAIGELYFKTDYEWVDDETVPYKRKQIRTVDKDYRNDCYAIEINEELTFILQQKGYKFIDRDFLKYSGDLFFNLIVMNPPFSNGDEHLLKAWDILNNGDVVCLLNAETINNPYTERRKHLCNLIRIHGKVEYLGKVFTTAERTTDVEVVCVRMHKKAADSKFSFFDELTQDADANFQFDKSTLDNQLARTNAIENMIIYYNKTKDAYVEYIKARNRLMFYGNPLSNQYQSVMKCVAEADENIRNKGMTNDVRDHLRYNQFIQELKSLAWNKIFRETEIASVLTASVREDFEKHKNQQGVMDLTRENIMALFDMLILNRGTILQQCILDVFDLLTSFDAKNKVHWEGWKTNDAYKVNRKVIVPWFIEFDNKYSDYGTYKVRYGHKYGIMEDVDKALCYANGMRYENCVSVQQALETKFKELGKIYPNDNYENTTVSTFFKIQFWKKGTLHMTFRDVKVWETFNIAAAKGKQWLPNNE